MKQELKSAVSKKVHEEKVQNKLQNKSKNKIYIPAQKKAQIEITFHWIFVLIAGAAILIFFIVLTNNQKKDSVQELSTIIGGRMAALLATIQQNPDSFQTLEMLNAEMVFRCEQDGHTYSLKDGKSRIQLETEIIFTPQIVGGSKPIVWTKLYAAPYPVTQILYLSDEKTQYIFIDDPLTKPYYDMLPVNFERMLVVKDNIKNITDQGFRQYIIVAPSYKIGLNSLQNAVLRKSKIVDLSKTNTEKKVLFYDPNSDEINKYQNSSAWKPYVNDEVLLGAIISGDEKLYGCTMEKLMHTARIVGEINLNRTNQIANIEKTIPECNYFFGTGVLQDYINITITNSTYPTNNYNNLNSYIEAINTMNKDMAKPNCPTIY